MPNNSVLFEQIIMNSCNEQHQAATRIIFEVYLVNEKKKVMERTKN